MSDTLIKRSLTVIMTHLSTAPDPHSYNTGCRRSIRACVCLWVSITALIPGGIPHIFQCAAIKTPEEAWSRWTTCRKICRDGRPGRGRTIRWTYMHSSVLPKIEGCRFHSKWCQKTPKIQQSSILWKLQRHDPYQETVAAAAAAAR